MPGAKQTSFEYMGLNTNYLKKKKKTPQRGLNLEPKQKHITVIHQSNFIPCFFGGKSLKNKMVILHVGFVIVFNMDFAW